MENRNLVYPKETLYFIICCLVSIGFYVALFFSLILIPIAAGLFLLSLFFHAVMIGSIRGNGVKVSKEQFPDVYERIDALSLEMRLPRTPDVYIIQSEGALNAFATRFFGRDVVVLYSEVFELARQQGEKELDFIIAHELAHIKRRHLWKSWLTLPAAWVPFLSNAYSRAAEYTCDRYAAHFIEDGEAAKRALTILGVGKILYTEVNEEAYVKQIKQETNPFVWLAEKLSTHPALPKRIQQVGQFLRLPTATDYRTPKGKVVVGAGVLTVASIALAAGGAYAVEKMDTSGWFSDLAEEALMEEDIAADEEITGETDVMLAALSGDTSSLERLIDEGADIHALNSNGETALHYATGNGQLETAEMLLEAGADPNLEDDAAYTPLWNAYEMGNPDMARLLIRYGADPNQEDMFGETVREVAESEGDNAFLTIFNEEKPDASLVN
ncbi:M48 family metallopeptidase [Domibacillus indicus]|uniref:M48 family metallopeptidase n=1 Tax=Domibacillus indicus TaxID=1437523 RepID=UPI00203BF5DD|nr:M48 family metallopeptidase [Domibacillus indicus]MCM3791231.1 M48 family metallopeptidase [Domibacillus indicus]